ncbi:rfaE bifunctional protein, domain I [Fictibacillus solisalsi]|uniref:RfaE bifunctional protein, domain I n=1 Tax=Fictibacillus solisalsi TaxID=459525 RepID=A0A1H0BS71_9BACL|nr:PfkB family carbohydrate kinase [Fictibacillus solisalsi]SDN48492.1 rfaE bifunctional protein, domain I [Fictibacillus solisalsi]
MDTERKKSVFVLGDIVLDCYAECHNQFSNNEEIQKLIIQKKKYLPGNAANVANNLSALGVDVYLFGVTGEDMYGDLLQQGLDPAIHKHIIKNPSVLTPLKSRFISKEKTVIRIDEEVYAPLLLEEEAHLLNLFVSLRSKIGYLVISDLNKGTYSDALLKSIIKDAIDHNIQVFIDPSAKRNLSVYTNATVISPNLEEFNALTDTNAPSLQEALLEAKETLKTHKFTYLLLKGDASGSILVSEHGSYHLPGLTKRMVSSIGAGDSFLAAFIASMIQSSNLFKSFVMANVAASISVSKKYTSTVTKSEIHHFLHELKAGGDNYGSIQRES